MMRSQQFPTPKKKAVVFDLDGTLVDTMKYEKHHKHHHPKFAKEALKADPIDKNIDKLKDKSEDSNIVILTARSAHYEDETKTWLDKHDVPYDKLVMRPEDDSTSKDKDLKASLLRSEILPKYNVVKAYDDKKKNVKMFKAHNIEAKQV
jgi:FMN phosphatase YigB (HAD superfamily)